MSELLDRLVADARHGGRTDPAAVRSVVGSVDLPDDDPDLAGADAYVRAAFSSSMRQPMVVRERAAAPRKVKKPRG